mgnify:CR=1 FL=1
MQTFLPYKCFEESLSCLDYRRLGKQRVEAYQILNVLLGRASKGWSNHPITKMWAGYENALKEYMNLSIKEWISRGYNNNMKVAVIEGVIEYPEWLGYDKFHSSHRGNLLRKDWDYYSGYSWPDNPLSPYLWFDTDKRQWYAKHTGEKSRQYEFK